MYLFKFRSYVKNWRHRLSIIWYKTSASSWFFFQLHHNQTISFHIWNCPVSNHPIQYYTGFLLSSNYNKQLSETRNFPSFLSFASKIIAYWKRFSPNNANSDYKQNNAWFAHGSSFYCYKLTFCSNILYTN